MVRGTTEVQTQSSSGTNEEHTLTVLRIAGVAAVGVLLGLGTALLGAAIWVRGTFGKISVEQLLLHLPGAGGAEVTGAESGYLMSFVLQALILPLGVLAAVLFLLNVIKHRSASRKATTSQTSFPWVKFLPGLLTLTVFAAGSGAFADTVGLAQYVRSQMTQMSMKDFYVSPGPDNVASAARLDQDGAKPKNLVFIYLESIEDQMSNEQLFERNMLEPLEEVTEGWGTIPDYQMFSSGGWTMAGLVGTSCGVPLRGAGIGKNDVDSNEIGSGEEDFMPGAVCLGDVLESEGYRNVFLGGADAEFASKGKFFSSHGYSEVRELSDWVAAGETELSEWGLSDRRLLDYAKEEVVRLHESGQPFNLTMLTLDSHEPAHLYDYCEQTTDDVFESVVRCSMEQVAAFVQFMEEMGYLEDTVIVLSGDHLKMGGGAYVSLGALNSLENRSVFNRIWSPDGVPATRTGADQLSMLATTLDVMGLGREARRAGIGVSALVSSGKGSVLDLDEYQYNDLIHSASSDLYQELWRRLAPEVSV